MSSLRTEHRLCTCLLVSRTNQVNEQNVKHVDEQNVSGSTEGRRCVESAQLRPYESEAFGAVHDRYCTGYERVRINMS